MCDVERWPENGVRHSVEKRMDMASDDDDMAAYIAQLEQARDTVDSPEASGDAIAEEFERYLRRREGRAGDDRSGGNGP